MNSKPANPDLERQWPRVRPILDRVLDLPTDERERAARVACGDDADLARAVLSLLACAIDDDENAFLRPPRAVNAEQLLNESAAAEAIGSRVGAYEVIDVISAGAMSAVYRARRADGAYDQQVAIKVLAAKLRTREAVNRFRRERGILARLDHPGISRLLDGGTMPDGRPYLVMEFIPGEPITRFARERQLDVRERAMLMIEVCRALQHAHHHLVIHRDLKPGNILITDDGRVKLLDFGVSELGRTDSTDRAADRAPMTERYAGPELRRGESATTSADVYAAGVILRELVDSTIRSAELDAIIRKACADDAVDRYSSAAALADDLERFLARRAVLAHPPTHRYRLRTFIRANRWPVALTTSVFTLVLAFGVLAAVLLVQLAEERSAALDAGQRAVEARDRALRINAYLEEMLISADPLREGGRSMDLLSMLEDASRAIGSLSADPVSRAMLHLTLGKAYLNLWLVRDAHPHIESALALLRVHAPEEMAVADALEQMGEVHHWYFNFGEAARHFREAAEHRLAFGENDADRLAHLALREGDSLARDERTARALERLVALVDADASDSAERRDTAAQACDVIALIHAMRGEGESAELFISRAATIRSALYGLAHSKVADGLENAIWVHDALGRTDLARAAAFEQLEMRIRLNGPRSPRNVMAYLHAAHLLHREGRTERALPLFATALAIAEEQLPDWHHSLRYARSVYASFLIDRERYEEADALLAEVRLATARLWGEDHQLTRYIDGRIETVREALSSRN